MASDDETGPSDKQISIDPGDPIMNVRTMNKLFPKIDNLEHFPLKVLINIFTRLDYMDLYNLAEESLRFESIAKMILNERYSHEYFIVDEYKHNQKTYTEFFERFGSVIKAINVRELKAINVEETDEENYEKTPYEMLSSLLDKANNLEKLILGQIPFYYNNDKILHHINENITHLIFRACDGFVSSTLPEFHNLKKLELFNKDWSIIDDSSLEKTIRNNPTLESLVLDEEFVKNGRTYLGMLLQFGPLVQRIGMHLKQLKKLEYTPRGELFAWKEDDETPRHFDQAIEKFVGSLKHLESLGLSSHVKRCTDFNTRCNNF